MGFVGFLSAGPAIAADTALSGEVGLSVGYDDNISYAPSSVTPVRTAWTGVDPWLYATFFFNESWYVGLSYAGVYRGYFGEDSSWLVAQVVDVPFVIMPSSWLDVRITLGLDHFYTGLLTDNHSLGGRLDTAATFYWTRGSATVGLGVHARHWLEADFVRTDFHYLPRAQFAHTFADVLTVLVGYQFAPRTSTMSDFDQWGHRAQIGVVAKLTADLDVLVSYIPYFRAYTADDAPWETAHVIRSGLSWTVAENWRLDLEAETTIQDGDTSARSFTANTVSLGVVWMFGTQRKAPQPLRTDELMWPAPDPTRTLTPVQQENGIRFRFQHHNATSVTVVGSFNGWDIHSHPLTRVNQSDLWETVIPLPPGIYEFAFVIDGQTIITPEQAEHYVDSGFGDTNGVVTVRPLYRE